MTKREVAKVSVALNISLKDSPDTPDQIDKCLAQVAEKIRAGDTHGPVLDSNDKSCGTFIVWKS